MHARHGEIPYPSRPGAAAACAAGGAGTAGRARPRGSAMLTEHDLRIRLAEALHEAADPVTRDAVGTGGIFIRGVRRRRRRTAARVTSALAVAALLAGAWALRPESARPPGTAESGHQPPGLLLDAAIARAQPPVGAAAGMP